MSVTQLPVHRRATTITQTPALAALAGGGKRQSTCWRSGTRGLERVRTYGASDAPKRREEIEAAPDARGRAGQVRSFSDADRPQEEKLDSDGKRT